MLPAHRCPAFSSVFLSNFIRICVCVCVCVSTANRLDKVRVDSWVCSMWALSSECVLMCVWLQCSQLWRRAFYDLCLLSGTVPPCSVPLLLQCSSLSFPTLTPLFSFSFSHLLSSFSPRYVPSHLSLLSSDTHCLYLPYLSVLVGVLAPLLFYLVPVYPLLSLFSSFLYFWVTSPLFFSLPSEVRLTAKWPSPERRGVVGGFAVFLFSLSSVCVWILAHALSLFAFLALCFSPQHTQTF